MIGAGIGGLACALGLQQTGWSVRVYEKAAALGEAGAGLTLSPNAVRALQWLGVYEPLRAHLSFPPYQISEDATSGVELGRLTRGARAIEDYGAPYAFVHRGDLLAALAAAVRRSDPHAIVVGAECVDVREAGSGAIAEFTQRPAATAELLVGCDGIRSRVRSVLHGDLPPKFTGYVAWRALVPYAALSAAALPAGSAIVFGDRRCVVRYRLEPRQLLNVAAFAECQEWTAESWTIRTDPEQLRARYADWHGGVRAALAGAAPDTLYQWGLFDRDPVSGYARGPIVLLGDAAHPMLPFLGQGAALALEDAVVLARVLAHIPLVPEALSRYDALRRPRGAASVLESRAAGRRLFGYEGDPQTRNEETLDYFRYDAAAVSLETQG